MTYVFFSISGITYLAAIALFNEITKKNARREPIVVPLARLTCLTIIATFSATSGMTTILTDRLTSIVERQNDRSQETREAKALTLDEKPLKSLPRYVDVLHGKVSKEFGDEFVTLFQEDMRYVIVKKIDFKSEEFNDLKELAKSDCNQILKDFGSGHVSSQLIDIRYMNTRAFQSARFDCSQIAMQERDRHVRQKE